MKTRLVKRHRRAESVMGLLAAAVLACPPGVAADTTACSEPLPAAYAPFEPARLSEDIRTLASDAFGGREPGSEGERLTLRFLTRRFAAIGLKPGGDSGGWTQAVPLRRFILDHASMRWRQGSDSIALQADLDWAGASLADEAQVNIQNAPVVFVGYGVSAPERGWDDYKGIDLHGKVAVYLVNDPDFETAVPGKFGGRAMTYYGRWTYKYEEAARRGAVAALIVHETAPATYGWATVRNSWGAAQFDIERADPRAAHTLFEGWLTRETAVKLWHQAGLDFDESKLRAMREDFRPIELPGASWSLSAHVTIQSLVSHNVIGILPGRSALNESVVYSAHWDHLGIGPPDTNGDRIYNGAVDNASGVAGLLELARVFATEPPTSRALLFLAFTGEEKGLLGSKFYVEHPVRPLTQTAAAFNMDMFNPYGGARDVETWGTQQNSLEQELAAQAAHEQRRFTPDDHLEAGYYYRSDHFSFARAGVPSVTIGSGRDLYCGGLTRGQELYQDFVAHHYHQPSDEWHSDWDLRGEALDLRLVHDVGRSISEIGSWPGWTPGSEFEATRAATNDQRRR